MLLLAAAALHGLCRPARPKGPLVVPATAVADELKYRTVTATTFEGKPLARHDVTTRSRALTQFARRCDADSHPQSIIVDAVAESLCVNGHRRAKVQAEYDWQRDGTRVACKSAQLRWHAHNHRWELAFRNVPFAIENVRETGFDELLLVAYTPTGVLLFRHDMKTGVSTNGRRTAATGHYIIFAGVRHETDWRAALDAIQEKMGKSCEHLRTAGFDDPRLAEAMADAPLSLTSQAYEGAPLSDLSAKARGDLLQTLVRRLDEDWLHPEANFSDIGRGGLPSPTSSAVQGRGAVAAKSSDNMWLRDGVVVSCKSASLRWDKKSELWRLLFRDVKLPLRGVREAAFDELLLAAYTPEGLHVFRHDMQTGVGTAGKTTATGGHSIQFFAPYREPDWRVAVGALLDRVLESCDQHVFVPWSEEEPLT